MGKIFIGFYYYFVLVICLLNGVQFFIVMQGNFSLILSWIYCVLFVEMFIDIGVVDRRNIDLVFCLIFIIDWQIYMFYMIICGILNLFFILFLGKNYEFNLDVCYQFYFDKDEKLVNYILLEMIVQFIIELVYRNLGK